MATSTICRAFQLPEPPSVILRLLFLEVVLGFSESFHFPASATQLRKTPWTSNTAPSLAAQNVGRIVGQRHTGRSLMLEATPDPTVPDETADQEQIFDDPMFLQRNKYWIVLVDDEEAIRMAVGDYLYDAGYQLSACADADAALTLFQNPRQEGELPRVPDAIVSDIRMEGKNGLELLKSIRTDERLKRVPVILLTAKAMTKDRIEGYRTGADAYISKPFDPEELLAILDNRILRRRQMKGSDGKLLDLKTEMADIKELMKRNGSTVVKKTNVYLTVAERQVLQLVCLGYTNAEIAQERRIGLPRVTKVMQKLYQETNVQTRTELVRWAIQTGYAPPR